MKNQLLSFVLLLFIIFVISKAQNTTVEEVVDTVTDNLDGNDTVVVNRTDQAPVTNDTVNTPDTPAPGPNVTIQAPPVPQDVILPADQAAADLSDAASDLSDVDGDVLITNPDGTTSIVDASDLASDLSDRASDLSDINGDVVVPDGGNVQFVPLNAQTLIFSAGALAAGCAYLLL